MHTSDDGTDAELRALVIAALGDLDDLVDGYLGQLAAIDGYADARIPQVDLNDTTRDAIELILRKAAGMPLSPRLEIVSESVGRRRAAQGVPLETLLQAVRMVFRLLWTSLHDRATLAEREALDRSAVNLWEAIEFHTVQVHAGYLDEVSRMRRDREAEIAVVLSRFLERDRPDTALTSHVAQKLGIDADGRFQVAAAPITALPDLRVRGMHATSGVHLYTRSDAVLILFERVIPPEVGRLLADLPIALAPAADGFARVPGAWRIAHDILMAMPPESAGTHTLAEAWPNLLFRRMPDLATSILGAGADDLRSAANRRLVLETTETYLRTGSIATTAEQMFCHRNTVLKRLARFKELTRLDPTIPWDAATIRLLLVALSQ